MKPTANDTEKYVLLYQQITQALIDNAQAHGSIDGDDAGALMEIKTTLETTIPDIGSYQSFDDYYAQQASEKLKHKKMSDIEKFESQHQQDSQVVANNKTLKSILTVHGCNYQNFVDAKPQHSFLSSSAMKKNFDGSLEPDNEKSQSLQRNLVGTALSGVICLAAIGVFTASVFFSGGLTLPIIGIVAPSLANIPFMTTAAMASISFTFTGVLGSRFSLEKREDMQLRNQAFQEARSDFLGEKPDLNALRQDPLYVEEQCGVKRDGKPLSPVSMIINFINPMRARKLENIDPTKGVPKVTTSRTRQVIQVLLVVIVVAAVAFFTGGLGLLPALPLLPAAMSTLATTFSISANAAAATLGAGALMGYSTSKYLARNHEGNIQKACNRYFNEIERAKEPKNPLSSSSEVVVKDPRQVRAAIDQYLNNRPELKKELTTAAQKQYQNQPIHQQISANLQKLQGLDETVSSLESGSEGRIHIHDKMKEILTARLSNALRY